MKILSKRLVPLLAVLALTAAPSRAAVITADVMVDLSTAISGGTWTGYAHPLANAVRVTSGDTVVINLSFAPNQRLTWNGQGYFNPWLMLQGWPGQYVNDQSGNFSWSNLSASLLGLSQGSQFSAGQLIGGNSGSIHLGPTNLLGSDSVVRTFTGATVSFLATWNDGDPFRDYQTIGYNSYYLFGGLVSYDTVPAPSLADLLRSL